MIKSGAPSVHRRALLAGVDSSIQGLISPFLFTMGWRCTVIQDSDKVPAVLQREAFDAVVIDLGLSESEAELTIMKIREVRPSLGDRIFVTSHGPISPWLLELTERYDLIPLAQDGLLPHLWFTLQDLVVLPRSRELPSRGMPAARMILDSLRYPLPAGVRGSSSTTRQLAFQYKKTIVDLSIESVDGSDRISLAGQILDGERNGKMDGLTVLLVSGAGTLARTSTNDSGEFHLECELPEGAGLEIRLGQRSWIQVPLGTVERAAKQKASSQTGTN